MSRENMSKLLEDIESIVSGAETSEEEAGEEAGGGQDREEEGGEEGVDIDSDGTGDGPEEANESISDGALDRLVDAMMFAPRVQNMLSRFGIDQGAIVGIKGAIVPALKMHLSKSGVGVKGASAARTAMRGMI